MDAKSPENNFEQLKNHQSLRTKFDSETKKSSGKSYSERKKTKKLNLNFSLKDDLNTVPGHPNKEATAIPRHENSNSHCVNNSKSCAGGLETKKDFMSDLESCIKNLKLDGKDKLEEVEVVTSHLQACRKACTDSQLVDVLEICEDLLKVHECNKNHWAICKKIKAEIVDIISNAIKKEFKNWDVLAEAKKGAQLMALSREVLFLVPWPTNERNKIMLEVFDALILRELCPKIKDGIKHWDPRNPGQMLEFLDYWELLLPQKALGDLRTYLYHSLENAINDWNPINDTAPLETWVCPWVKMFGIKLENFHPIIFHHLEQAMVDVSAEEINPTMMMKAGLSVLNEKSRFRFIINNVVPKLNKHLENMTLHQNFESLKRVTDWATYLPEKLMADMLKDMFFPKLIKVIAKQIFQRTFEAASVGVWLAAWLNNIPKKLKMKESMQRCICDCVALTTYGIYLEAEKAK